MVGGAHPPQTVPHGRASGGAAARDVRVDGGPAPGHRWPHAEDRRAPGLLPPPSEILVEQKTPQGFFSCDHAGGVLNKFSLPRQGQRKLAKHGLGNSLLVFQESQASRPGKGLRIAMSCDLSSKAISERSPQYS